ncbi:MAG: hypothetical protein ABI383_13245 [Acidobacteriaceae bacterium]
MLSRVCFHAVGLWMALALPLAAQSTTGLDLYRRLATTSLDGQRIFHIRDADLDLEDLHLSFEEGTIAFTQAVDGRTTGALFTGDGAVLVIPPDQVERASLARFTRSAVLDEHFHSVYLRFNDEATAKALEEALRGPEKDAGEFFTKWDPLAKSLAAGSGDALRLTLSLLNQQQPNARFVHARIAGNRLGVFDALYDRSNPEAVIVAQSSGDMPGAKAAGAVFENVWLSFPSRSQRAAAVGASPAQTQAKSRRAGNEAVPQTDQLQPDENGLTALLEIHSFDLSVDVAPTTEISATAKLQVTPRQPGVRAALFQLSHDLKVKSVQLDGAPVEFLQNPAIAGSQTARTGNDLVAVVLPAPLNAAPHELTFQYAGPVMTDTGGGFLYVGDRGTWYPNFGMRNAMFDLRFRVPTPWKLVATGEPAEDANANELHFRTARPVPVVGFNVGRFTKAQASPASHSAVITAYGTEHADATTAVPLKQMASRSAEVVDFLEQHLGAFPYHELSITEVPGGVSQGWPGLVYLSTGAFSTSKLGAEPRTEFARIVFEDLMLPHEIGHQYWGDNVAWRSYREQWTSEALANYCALMFLEQKNAKEPGIVLGHYRDALLRPTTPDAPVTLGLRLDSSLSPNGYALLTYGRGTWLVHMLRMMMRDGYELQGKADPDADAAFWQALKSVQTQFAGKAVGAADLRAAFEKVLPRSLNYEGAASLEWFSEDWVNGTSVPRFALTQVKIAPSGAASGMIETTEIPKEFTALLPIYAEMKDGKRVLVAQVFADDPETTFKVKVPAGTIKLLLDPEHEVLRRE